MELVAQYRRMLGHQLLRLELGATVKVAATPVSGSAFTGWSGDCTGPANPCSITMSADKAVTATFTVSTGAGQFDGAYAGT